MSFRAGFQPARNLQFLSAHRLVRRLILVTIHSGISLSTKENVWQRRFYDFTVWTERKCIEKLRYMHRNPVVRGLVLEPGQWPWSSFRYYACRETGPVLVNEPQRPEMRFRNIAS